MKSNRPTKFKTSAATGNNLQSYRFGGMAKLLMLATIAMVASTAQAGRVSQLLNSSESKFKKTMKSLEPELISSGDIHPVLGSKERKPTLTSSEIDARMKFLLNSKKL